MDEIWMRKKIEFVFTRTGSHDETVISCGRTGSHKFVFGGRSNVWLSCEPVPPDEITGGRYNVDQDYMLIQILFLS